jgi:RimJ/RimL family protein N-acetyltransferase
MKLLPLDHPELVAQVAGWLGQKENNQWLDFGDGRQRLSPEWLKVGIQRGTHVVRAFTDEAGIPIGAVGLSNLNPHFKTGTMWVVLGEKSRAGRGHATRAVSAMLTLGFRELGLAAISTWIVEHNPSVRVAERVGFRPFGRQRQCHYIDGKAYDRLWFDLLASEHLEAHS